MDPLDRQHAAALALQSWRGGQARIVMLVIKDDFEPLPSPIYCGSYYPARLSMPAIDASSFSESLRALSDQLKQFERATLDEADRIATIFNLFITPSRALRRQQHFARGVRSAMAYHARHEARRSGRSRRLYNNF